VQEVSLEELQYSVPHLRGCVLRKLEDSGMIDAVYTSDSAYARIFEYTGDIEDYIRMFYEMERELQARAAFRVI